MNNGEDFSKSLQNAFIEQTRKILNLNLYTKAILSTLPVAIIATDKDGRINFMNTFAEGLFEIKSSELRGKALITILETNEEVVNIINDALNDQKENSL